MTGYQRYCLNLHGYSHLSDVLKGELNLALRFKPAVCAALALIGLVTQSVPLVLLLAFLGYWAAFFPNHPVDLIYQGVLQRVFGAPDLGQDPAPRRFACGMAATLLLGGAVAWQVEATVVGTVLVGMTALALLTLVVAGFCVGSFFYWLLVRRQIFRGA